MITPISFKGTYELYPTNEQACTCAEFMEAINQDGQMAQRDLSYPSSLCQSMPVTCVVSDNYNKVVENFCKANGISFERIDEQDLTSKGAIEKRIVAPKKHGGNTFIAKLNVEKLEKLLETQETNIHHCQADYEKYHKEDVEFMIKSGKPIPATCFIITSNMAGGDEGAIEYIEKYGDDFNKNSLLLDFEQMTDEPDHCVYFGLKDLGMKEIPVCVNESTFEIGEKIGLLSE